MKIDFLDRDSTYCLRGIAMLMIIISHSANGYPTDDALFSYPQCLNQLHVVYWGGMGVAIFLFLSGYGMFLSLSRKSEIDTPYIVSKFRRLIEPFLLYWVVEIIVLVIYDPQALTFDLLKEICKFSIHPHTENWFFKVIVAAYIVIILLFKMRLSARNRVLLLFALSLAYLIYMKSNSQGEWWYNTILLFPIGALVAWSKDYFERLSPLRAGSVCLLLLASVLVYRANMILFHIAFVFICIYAIRWVNIRNRILYFIGYNSFVFYFMECPILDNVMKFTYHNFIIYTLLSLLGTFALSWVCVKALQYTNAKKHR